MIYFSFPLSDFNIDGEVNQHSPLHRKRLVKKEKRNKPVSKSLENIYKVCIYTCTGYRTHTIIINPTNYWIGKASRWKIHTLK